MPAISVSERTPLTPVGAGIASRRQGVVVPYDFRRPSKLSREHIRVLQMAYETFARRLTTLLTSGLRQLCQVTVSDITQSSYEEYVTGLQTQTLLCPLAVPPLAGTGVLEFSLPVALAAIDHMLGGPGGTQSPRTLTDIETSLLRGLLDQMVATLRYSLEPIVPLTPTLGPIEYNPQFVQAAGATDAVVIGEFDMVVGAERCRATLCLPLAPLLPRLMAQRPREGFEEDAGTTAATAQRLRERLGDVPLDVAVRFDPVALSPEQILSLAEGDLIPLSHRAGTPLTVQAGGITFASAVAGRSGRRLAALIVDTFQESAS